MNGPEPLEQRIAAALGDNEVMSTTVADLITETQTAIAAAEAAVTKAKKDALDTSRLPDPIAARDAIASAEFKRDWLKSALPKLQRRQQQLEAQGEYDDWRASFDAVKQKHAAAVGRLQSAYALVPELVEALQEARAVDAEVRRVMQAKPYLLPQSNGDGKSLPAVECAARGLRGVATGYSLMTDLKLPVFDQPNGLCWPPPMPPIDFRQIIPPNMLTHPGADWAAHQKDAKAQADAEAKRVIEFYKRQQEQREAMDAAAARAEWERRQQQAST
jgi:hypothetical protein